jgi:protoheme IX farnesyltransferase
MLRDYFELTKPAMVRANVFIAAAVYLFASHWQVDWTVFLLLLLGLTFTIAGGCVLNNIYDKDIDAKMSRTKNRVMTTGRINLNAAMVFGAFLVALGIKLLWFINTPTLIAGLVGALVYVFVYTPLKHTSGLSLYVGAVAGATPPLIGYAAATGTLDSVAWLLFAFMFLWQVPHFFAISRYRYDEYAAAGIPLLVARPKDEAARTQARKLFFGSLIFLLLACVMLAAIGYFA